MIHVHIICINQTIPVKISMLVINTIDKAGVPVNPSHGAGGRSLLARVALLARLPPFALFGLLWIASQ